MISLDFYKICTAVFFTFLIQSQAQAVKVQFVLVTSSESNTLTSYKVDDQTGQWSKSDCVSTGKRPMGLCSITNTDHVYVAENDENQISHFSLNPKKGALSGREKISTMIGPMGLCQSPDGKYLFCVGNDSGESDGNASSEIRVYSVGTGEGKLAELSVEQVFGYPQTIAVHPSFPFVYVPSCTRDSILVYYFDPVQGKLTLHSEHQAGARPTALAIDSSGKYLVVANRDSNNLWSYRIDLETGEPQPSSEVNAGACPEDFVISDSLPSQIEVASKCSEEIHSFSLSEESRGSKKEVSCKLQSIGEPYKGLQLPSTILAIPHHPFIYVLQSSQLLAESQDKIAVFKRNAKTSQLEFMHEFPIEGNGEKTLKLIEQDDEVDG